MQDKKIANILWLLGEKVLRLALNLLVVSYLAKYLGPSSYGELNYAISIVSIVTVISSLGVDSVLLKRLIEDENNFLILKLSYTVKFIFSFLAYITLALIVYFFSDQYIYIYLILGLNVIFNNLYLGRFYLESLSKQSILARILLFSFIVSSLLKLLIIHFELGYNVLVATFIIEPFISLILGEYIIRKIKCSVFRRMKVAKFSISKTKELLIESLPLVFTSVAWLLYTRVDIIMLGLIEGHESVGIYSAAVKISEVTNFIPAILVSVITPLIYKDYKNRFKYDMGFQSLFYFITIVMVFITLLIFMVSEDLINFVFGHTFFDSISVLKIHAWCGVIMGHALISGRYLLFDNMQKITLHRHVTGLSLNLVMNVVLIPFFGVNGAAIATLLSLFISNVMFDYFNNKTRHLFYMKIKSILFFGFINEVFNKNSSR